MYLVPLRLLHAAVCALAMSAGFVTGPRAIVERAAHEFGNVEQGARLVHQFSIRNAGTSPLTVAKLTMSAPGMTARIKPAIVPGAEETLTVEWDTARANGTVEGKVVLDVNDPETPQLTFVLTAVVAPPIEFLPYQAVFTSVYQGEPGRRVVRVVNHREQPLVITRLEQQGDHFRSGLKTIEAGRAYELEVSVPDGVPPGRYTEAVYLYPDDPAAPRFMVPVNILVKADLAVNPETVDFGRVSLADLAKNPFAVDLLKQTLIIRKRAGTFSITSVASDVAGVAVQRSPDGGASGDAFRIDVLLAKGSLQPGRIDGHIRIRTDDPRFPEIVVSVVGLIE